MFSKVISGHSFYGACRYILREEAMALVLEAEGVRAHDYRLMAEDFINQHALRPTKTQACFHGVLSFYPGEKLSDEKMVEIAKQYLKELQITDTQYAIVKHTNKDHPHLHILANLVNNKGQSIKDNWMGLRAKKITQKLTLQYQLVQSHGKNLKLTHLEALRQTEANRYKIYQAVLEGLCQAKNLQQLEQHLLKQGIDTQYKLKRGTQELQGISFRLGQYCFKGSTVDRKFSIAQLQKTLAQKQAQRLTPFREANELRVTHKRGLHL